MHSLSLEGLSARDGGALTVTLNPLEDYLTYNGKRHVWSGTAVDDSQKKTMAADFDIEINGFGEYDSLYKKTFVYSNNINAAGMGADKPPQAYMKLTLDKTSELYKSLGMEEKSAAAAAVAAANQKLKTEGKLTYEIRKRDLSKFAYESGQETKNRKVISFHLNYTGTCTYTFDFGKQ